MRAQRWWSAVIGVLFAFASSRAAEAPPAFGWLGELAGACWAGELPDGKGTHTQCYTTQFGRFLRGTATLDVRDAEGSVRRAFEGDSVYAADGASGGRFVYYIWASDGSHSRNEAEYLAGNELSFPVLSRSEPGTVVYRSVWRRIDAEHFEVRRERPDGAGWRTEFKVDYRRVEAAAAVSPNTDQK
jgi:hypothetical protein